MANPKRQSRDFATIYSSSADAQLDFCRSLPKVELHAHLNGCIRDATLRELAGKTLLAGKPICLDQLVTMTELTSPTLGECFALFDVLHQITTNHAAIRRIAREALEDFAADNVFYAEIRTTPKCRSETGVSRETYVEAVLQGIEDYYVQSRRPRERDIHVRLLLSINRQATLEEAEATVQLAAEMRERGVVGVDLTGNPTQGEWRELLPAMEHARREGLKVSLDAGEGYNPAETAAMLEWRPDRLAYCCCLTPELEAALLRSGIPLEVCLTSNLLTRAIRRLGEHRFPHLYRRGHPLVLCTDDPGILNTSLSREYAVASQAFKLTQRQLLALALGAAEHAFLEAEEKVELQDRMRAALPRALLLRMQQEEALAQAAGSQGTEPPLLETARAELASSGKVAEAAPRMLPPAWRRMWVAPSSRRHSL